METSKQAVTSPFKGKYSLQSIGANAFLSTKFLKIRTYVHYKTATSSLIPHPLHPCASMNFPLLKMNISCSDRRKYSFQTLKCQIVLMTPEVLGDERTN